MSKRTRMVVAVFICGIFLFGIGLAIMFASRPAMPNEWSKLRLGMPRQEALALLPDKADDMRQFKDFDVTTHETTMLGLSFYWQLLIYCDEKSQVKNAEAWFACREYGFLSTKPKSILR